MWLRNSIRSAIARYKFYVLGAASAGFNALSLTQKILVINGFFPESILSLNVTHRNKKLYLSDFSKKRVSARTNLNCQELLFDKVKFQREFEGKVTLPVMLGTVRAGVFESCSADETEVSIPDLLRQGTEIVCKPIFGGMGRGLYFLSHRQNELVRNGELISLEDLEKWIGQLDDYLISIRVEQHSCLSTTFPATTNALRMVTMRDVDNDEVFISAAFQRFGTSWSMPSDNYFSGALVSHIDICSGRLGIAMCKGRTSAVQRLETHPDSGEKITGLILPNWDIVKTKMVEIVEAYPGLDYVGWDIVVTESGFTLIEGNHNPSTLTQQMNTPMLVDRRVNRFMSKKSII